MNNKLKLLPLVSLLLTGCGSGARLSEKDYITVLPYKSEFRMLVMGDIHFGNKDDLDKHLAFMDLTFKDPAANPDLIILNGDLFTFGEERTLRKLFDHVNSLGIPWGVTYGNHDEQCFFTVDHMSRVASEYSNSVFKYNPDDDVYGYSNYCVNLVEEGITRFSIYCLDSNRYRYSPYIGYDYIHKDQIDWYERMVNYNGGESVKSYVCYHIPVPEYDIAWEAAQRGEADALYLGGEKNEKVCCPKENSGFFDKQLELKSTIGNICSHDHINDYQVVYKGISLTYSVNATGRIYGDPNKRGGTLITIYDGEDAGITRIYHSESEVE